MNKINNIKTDAENYAWGLVKYCCYITFCFIVFFLYSLHHTDVHDITRHPWCSGQDGQWPPPSHPNLTSSPGVVISPCNACNAGLQSCVTAERERGDFAACYIRYIRRRYSSQLHGLSGKREGGTSDRVSVPCFGQCFVKFFVEKRQIYSLCRGLLL